MSTGAALRSQRWFGPDTLRGFAHRSRVRQLGYGADDVAGRPVIAILNTWSDLNPCHAHFRERVEDVKRGVWQAGGWPVELPALSLAEPFQKPTTMLYRNLLAMETEELLRSYPADGAVLMGGCDKTTPGLVMGATSMDLPFVYLPAGPMLSGRARGQVVGSGTAMWRAWDERRAGASGGGAGGASGPASGCASGPASGGAGRPSGQVELDAMEEGIARSAGHCMTMGTASTMTAAVEALGLSLPGASSIPAVDSGHARMAAAAGRRAVALVREDLRPSRLLGPASFDNAVTVVLALGGSTNATIHLVAMAGRAGVDLTLERFDQLSRLVPVLADVQPSGRFLMEDFHYAGGLRGLMARLGPLLDGSALTVTGRTLGEELAGAEVFDDAVIRPLDDPLSPEGGLAVVRGSLAPDGAVIKPTAASPHLLAHTGPAVVFAGPADLEARIDDPTLAVDEDSVLVLQNAGPVGGPGMPEWGMLPLPRRLLARGVRDLVRVSDARMSGTSYGTCVLHVAPESAVGGPLALVRDGDPITLDVGRRRLDLEVPVGELDRRRRAWT
ncbi:MAG: dihydroxy-acid dehydratase, partial [Acidimicrobiales bacterium]